MQRSRRRYARAVRRAIAGERSAAPSNDRLTPQGSRRQGAGVLRNTTEPRFHPLDRRRSAAGILHPPRPSATTVPLSHSSE